MIEWFHDLNGISIIVDDDLALEMEKKGEFKVTIKDTSNQHSLRALLGEVLQQLDLYCEIRGDSICIRPLRKSDLSDPQKRELK